MTNKPNIEKERQKWIQILVRDIPLKCFGRKVTRKFQISEKLSYFHL